MKNLMVTLAAALVFAGCEQGVDPNEPKVTGGEESECAEIDFARHAGHSHLVRNTKLPEEICYSNLVFWLTRNNVEAFGGGSPWSNFIGKIYVQNEKEDRDLYWGGKKADQMEELTAAKHVDEVCERIHEKVPNCFVFPDNETPKSPFGHMWHVGFKVVVPAWHDYDQNRPCWYSEYDNDKAEKNAITGDYQKRRTYSQVIAEQRANGAISIWAHPTSWWTWDGKNKGPFVTNIATDMIPQLMRDGYLDGMVVQGYDAYHIDYQNLWFALLDLGYRVPGFSEMDLCPMTGSMDFGGLFNMIPDPVRPLTMPFLIKEFKAAHHTMSSGAKLLLKVDGELQGADIKSGAGKKHKVEVFAWPVPGQKEISVLQLLGRGGEILAEKTHFKGGKVTWYVKGDDEGGYLVARCFGEEDGNYREKRQQETKHMAMTNPVWLRTPKFQPPAPIAAPDPMTITEVRQLEDFLLKGEFRFDPRADHELTPGEVPVWAFQIDKVREALVKAAEAAKK